MRALVSLVALLGLLSSKAVVVKPEGILSYFENALLTNSGLLRGSNF
jgi:hypothetical protein